MCSSMRQVRVQAGGEQRYVVQHSILERSSEGKKEVVKGELERWAPHSVPTHSIAPVRERARGCKRRRLLQRSTTSKMQIPDLGAAGKVSILKTPAIGSVRVA